jgi:hypothetical protein
VSRPRWTPAEDATLRALYPTTLAKAMEAVLPGRNRSAIKQRAWSLGMTSGRVGRPSPAVRSPGEYKPRDIGLPRYAVDRAKPLRWAL